MKKIRLTLLPLFFLLMLGCSTNSTIEDEIPEIRSGRGPFLGGSGPTPTQTVDIQVNYLLPASTQDRTEIRAYYNGVINISQITVCPGNSDVETWTIDYMNLATFQSTFMTEHSGTFDHVIPPTSAADGEVEVEITGAPGSSNTATFEIKFIYNQSCQ